MKAIASLILATAAVVLAGPAAAQFAKPEDAVKYRQNSLYVMGQHFGRIGAMVNGRAPYDAAAAVANAEIVATMARLPWAAFGPGTDKVTPSRAKSEIWTEPAKFKEQSDKLIAEAPKLLAAARTNNLETLKTAFGATAATCKGCHDDYQAKAQ